MIPGSVFQASKKNPLVLTFSNVTGSQLSTLAETSTVPTGYDGSVFAFVSGADAQIRKNSTGTWGTSVSLQVGDTLNIRMTSSASFGTPVSATVKMGTITSVWSITTAASPAVTFTSVNPQHLSTATVATVTNPSNVSVTYSVTGSGGVALSNNNSTYASTATVAAGGVLYIRMTSSGSYATTLSATVSWTGGSSNWTVTTLTNPTISFTSLNPVAADGNYSYISCVNHSNMAIVISTSGGGGLLISPDGTVAYSTSTTVPAGQTFWIAQTSATTFSTTRTGTISWEGGSTTWSITSQTNPSISFTNVNPQHLNTWTTATAINNSNLVTTFTVSGSGNDYVSNDNSSWASTATVAAGGTLYILQYSSASYATAITDTVTWLGGGSTTWSVTTLTSPSITFTNVNPVAVGGVYNYTTGVNHSNMAITVSFSGGINFVGSPDNISYATSITVGAGATFWIANQSSASYSTNSTGTISWEGSSTTWTITSQSVPSPSFSSVTGAIVNTNYVETSLNHSNMAMSFTSSGGFISNDGSSWSTSATVAAGGTLYSYQTSNSTYGSGAKSMTISYYGGSTSWTVTTQPVTTGSPLNYTSAGTFGATIYFNSITVSVTGATGTDGTPATVSGTESVVCGVGNDGTTGGNSTVSFAAGTLTGAGGTGGVAGGCPNGGGSGVTSPPGTGNPGSTASGTYGPAYVGGFTIVIGSGGAPGHATLTWS